MGSKNIVDVCGSPRYIAFEVVSQIVKMARTLLFKIMGSKVLAAVSLRCAGQPFRGEKLEPLGSKEDIISHLARSWSTVLSRS